MRLSLPIFVLSSLKQVVSMANSSGDRHTSRIGLARLDANAVKLDGLNIGVEEISRKVEDLDLEIKEISRKLDEPRPVALNLHAHVQGSGLVSATSNMHSNPTAASHAQLQIVVRQEPQAVSKDDLMELRSAIMSAITGERGGHGLSSAEAGRTSQLSDTDRITVNSAILRDLSSHPNTLSRAMAFLGEDPCNCRPIRERRSIADSRWLSWRYEFRQRHDVRCPYRQFEGGSWRHRLSLQLMPFMRKTVQVAFSATRRGGGCHIEFPIRVFSTVKRSESYIFEIFDGFPARCNARERGSAKVYESDRAWINRRTGKWFAGFEWDVAKVRKQLAQMRQLLLGAKGNGVGSIGDKDEEGHTVFYVSLSSKLSPRLEASNTSITMEL